MIVLRIITLLVVSPFMLLGGVCIYAVTGFEAGKKFALSFLAETFK